jgi:hypothetical protein
MATRLSNLWLAVAIACLAIPLLTYKHEEPAGDGGHYDSFGSSHDVNYHLRGNGRLLFACFDSR